MRRLVGAATYAGDLTPFWVHVGKGATFGLGGYRLEPTAAREASWG